MAMSNAQKKILETSTPVQSQTVPFPLKRSSFISWFLQKGYLQGVFWAIMINVFSSLNDVIMRYTGERVHWIEISFFRYLFSTLVVLPFMFKRTNNKNLFYTQQPFNHFLRGLIGAIALSACCFSVNFMPLYENSTIMFTEPMFFLIMAFFILKEHVDWRRWLCTLAGFLGLAIVLQPGTSAFQWAALVPVGAAVMFAYLNVMAKTMIKDEPTLSLLFYFGVVTTILTGIPLYFFWETPTLVELLFFALLGLGANLIQVCLFKAFSATEASALSPFRYVELLTGSIFGYLFFKQIPKPNILLGAVIIICSTLFITIAEQKRSTRSS